MKRVAAEAAEKADVWPLRERYRNEVASQIVHDSWIRRGLAKPFLLKVAGKIAGYAAVTGPGVIEPGMVSEFYLDPPRRHEAPLLWQAVVAASGADKVRAQTNDPLLHAMLDRFGTDIATDALLFADGPATHHPAVGAVFRKAAPADAERMFAHEVEPVGDWVLDAGGIVVATGGYADHYNPPFVDIHMEVARTYRQRGFGTYLVQELRRVCREAKLIPAARCRPENEASRRTLERAGLVPSGRVLVARLKARGDRQVRPVRR